MDIAQQNAELEVWIEKLTTALRSVDPATRHNNIAYIANRINPLLMWTSKQSSSLDLEWY